MLRNLLRNIAVSHNCKKVAAESERPRNNDDDGPGCPCPLALISYLRSRTCRRIAAKEPGVMQCNRNMVRCAWRMDVHISPLFRLLLQIPYEWHRRSSDQVAVDVRFYLFAFNSSIVFQGLHAGQVYPERKIHQKTCAQSILQSGSTTQADSYLPAYPPKCRAVADEKSRGTVDRLGCIIPL